MSKSIFKSFDDTWDKKNVKQYTCLDRDGKTVMVNRKNPTKHDSSYTLDQHPTYFLNLEQILLNPNKVQASKSNNPKAILNRQKGVVLEYSMDDYINNLDIPGQKNKGDTTTVVVLYESPSIPKAKNITLTYYTKPKI